MAHDIIDYDFKSDSLFLKKRKMNYHHSINFGDFIIDLDEKEKAWGMEILNVSKYFKLDKIQLSEIKKVFGRIELTKTI